MKKKEDVLELFRKKYDHLKTIFPSAGEFKESALYQTPDEGWQLSIDSFAAITLRPNDDIAHETHGTICARWHKEGGAFDEHQNPGWLGYPISDENVYDVDGDSNDRISHFEHGDIIWTAKTDMTRVIKKDTTASAMEKTPELVAILKEFDKEKQSLDKIKQALDQDGINQDSKKVLKDVVASITRRRRAFDSKTFFMVTFGMLKAGKSTLVNTFVGRKVSPIGRAKETTLRSSIILAADSEREEGIYVYSPKNGYECTSEDSGEQGEGKWQERNLGHLMDYLGGIEELDDSLREELVPLTGEELDNLLTREVDPRFPNMLPPVIRVNTRELDGAMGTANLLTGGVAIIDTPGLDGVKSNMYKDPFLKNIKSHGDYYLLVQSSMSAMNNDCRNQLDSIFQYTRNAALLVVYNEIAANFWLKPEEEKKKLLLDAEDAFKEIVEKLRKMNGLAPVCKRINAGEAADAMFDPESYMRVAKDVMLKESRVRDLRDHILKTLRDDRREIKERTARVRMMQELKTAIANCECQREKIDEAEKKKKKEEEKAWEMCKNKSGELCNAFNDKDGVGSRIAERYGDALREALKNKDVGLQNPWQKGLVKNGEMRDSKREIPNEDVDKELTQLHEMFRKKFISYVEDNFDRGALRRSNTPWKDIEMGAKEEWDGLEKLWTELKEFLKNDKGPSDAIPDCLLKAHDIDEFVRFTAGCDFNPQVPDVYNPWWRIACKTRYECYCHDAWQDLFDKLKRLYFGEPGKTADAIKKVQEAFRDAIKEKGHKNALNMQSCVYNEIGRMEQASARRSAAIKNELRLFDEAKACMERMHAKLTVI